MRSWQIEAGQIECRWFEVGQRVEYNPRWMQDASDAQGSFVPPITDFASHSPFGGATWFLRYTPDRDPK